MLLVFAVLNVRQIATSHCINKERFNSDMNFKRIILRCPKLMMKKFILSDILRRFGALELCRFITIRTPETTMRRMFLFLRRIQFGGKLERLLTNIVSMQINHQNMNIIIFLIYLQSRLLYKYL